MVLVPGKPAPSVLVCGSVAIDMIGQYEGSFEAYQRRYAIDALNISLQLSELRSSFGGCGMNISYGLHLLGVDVIPLAAVGSNFADHYQPYLTALGINTEHIVIDSDFQQGPTGIVISDDSGNQITTFHAGAALSKKRKLPSQIAGIEDCKVAVLAPELAPIMLRQARDLHGLGIPIVLDPGQCLAGFNQAETLELLELAQIAMLNEHEFEILLKITKLPHTEIKTMLDQLVITHSAAGVDVYQRQHDKIHVDAIEVPQRLDSTGCGDAFRAGYVYGLVNGYEADKCALFGNLIAAENIQCHEPQKYQITEQQLLQQYQLHLQ